jgi:carboxylate-amine ligase
VPPPSADSLRARFDSVEGGTLGLEEEVFLVDADTLELAPRASELLPRLDADPRYKLELPAAQLEIVVGPSPDVPAAIDALARARTELARVAASDGLAVAAVGVHPLSAGAGALNAGKRYGHTRSEYGPIAARQLVSALQVHVAVGGAERTLAVYNALRAYLPLIAALAANAPFYEGADSGLASVRPKLCELLPRQGVPPAIPSWEAFAEELAWGARAGTVLGARTWWWELRPHTVHGTLELRVPDTQATVLDASAVAALGHCLVAWLAERHDAGDDPPPVASWRIEENRWSACRHGTHGVMADLTSGEPEPTLARLERLLDELAPTAERLGAVAGLQAARGLARTGGGASALRRAAHEAVAAAGGQPGAEARGEPAGAAARAAAQWLARVFADATALPHPSAG